MFRNTAALACAVALCLSLAGCGQADDEESDEPGSGPGQSQVGDTVALTASGRLVSFNRATPATIVGSVALAGMAAGETLVGIDVRPADGRLYGVGTAGNVYAIDPATGTATLRAVMRPSLAGTSFAVDFDPSVDRLRVVSDTGRNLRVDVDTGATATDGAINRAGAVVTAAAYTNALPGATGTQLFALDAAAGRLHLQDPPSEGNLDAGVTLGVTAEAANGFDIDARSNTGYAALRVGGETALYSVDLGAAANAATRIGMIGTGETMRGVALMTNTAPVAVALTQDNRLVAFDPAAPNRLSSNRAISGLAAGESVLGIDFRPRDSLLYAVSSSGRLFTIDPETGAARLRAVLVADPADTTAPFAGLTSNALSVDFNPASDRLRVIGADGQNLRIVVETQTSAGVRVVAGQTTTEGAISGTTGFASVVAAAYSNNFADAATTALHALDRDSDRLMLQTPPDSGAFVQVGPLGVNIAGAAAFDIAGGANGIALAALRTGTTGPFTLYSISLSTGAATLFRNTVALSLIGGASGPANLLDLAIHF